jgi:hypothetical protein
MEYMWFFVSGLVTVVVAVHIFRNVAILLWGKIKRAALRKATEVIDTRIKARPDFNCDLAERMMAQMNQLSGRKIGPPAPRPNVTKTSKEGPAYDQVVFVAELEDMSRKPKYKRVGLAGGALGWQQATGPSDHDRMGESRGQWQTTPPEQTTPTEQNLGSAVCISPVEGVPRVTEQTLGPALPVEGVPRVADSPEYKKVPVNSISVGH